MRCAFCVPFLVALGLAGCQTEVSPVPAAATADLTEVSTPEPALYSGVLTGVQRKIVEGARVQLEWNTRYDNAYYRIDYPGGDLPPEICVCTDVVVRALRAAGFDLQQLIHEDMKIAWTEYPRYAGHPRPDPNIDHRRVPNQMRFFERHGMELTKELDEREEWKPGDIVYWKLDSGLDHTGVLSDRVNADGFPLVIHNLGTTREEDVLAAWTITGHFRYSPIVIAEPDSDPPADR